MSGPRRAAFVTGSGRGIGRAIALALAADGLDVALFSRTESELDHVATEIQAIGTTALPLAGDVRHDEDVLAAVSACAEHLGPPLILVNNAGIAPSHKFLDIDSKTWNQVLDVNLTSAYRFSHAALPHMLEAGFGRIINVASTAGKRGYAYTAAYTASKHGLVGLTRALAIELAGKGITVNAVCPGFTRTDITTEAARNIAARTGRSTEHAENELTRMSPLGRLIEPEEVARAVAFLVRDESAGITGQAWNIDGGSVQS